MYSSSMYITVSMKRAGKKGENMFSHRTFLFVSLNTQQTHDKDRGRGGTREREKKIKMVGEGSPTIKRAVTTTSSLYNSSHVIRSAARHKQIKVQGGKKKQNLSFVMFNHQHSESLSLVLSSISAVPRSHAYLTHEK